MKKLINFNSIKVRLEHNLLVFRYVCILYFNSIKVRLEQDEKSAKGKVTYISIP